MDVGREIRSGGMSQRERRLLMWEAPRVAMSDDSSLDPPHVHGCQLVRVARIVIEIEFDAIS